MTITRDAALDRLLAAGLAPEQTTRKIELLLATRTALDHPARNIRDYFVPGRIEVLGKHTDYAGGRSLLCAVERGFIVSAAPRDDGRVVVSDVVTGVSGEFRLASDQESCTHWHNYPATVVRRLARNFSGPLGGIDLAFGSDLPRSAGLSSSTVLVIAVFTALADRNALETHPEYAANIESVEDLAAYLGAIENGRTFGALAGDTGVGTLGGSQDHTAILCARPGRVVGYRFAPVERERDIALPEGLAFVVASSGVAASKTGSARASYNRAAEMTAAMLTLWRETTGEDAATLGSLDRRDRSALARLRQLIASRPATGFGSDELIARLDQFVGETLVIIPDAASALEAGDLSRFGALVAESQAGAERGLSNQVPETMALVRAALAHGAVAASAFGAGFGGSVWALVAREEVARFMRAWREDYTRQFPDHAGKAELFDTRAGPPLVRL